MIEPFTAKVPEADLADLQRRLAATRWAPEQPTGAEDGAYGVPLTRLRRLVARWQEFDWRGDFRSIRRLAERDHARITSWNKLPGVTGHYSAHTSPDQLAGDIRRFFRPLRPAASKEN